MKKIIIVALVIVAPFILLSQNSKMEKVFNKFKNVDGFELSVSDSNIDVELEESYDFTDLLNSVNKIYIMNMDVDKGSKNDITNFIGKISKISQKEGFKPMVEVNSDGKFSINLKRDENGKAIEVLMINSGSEEAICIWIN